MPWLNPHLHQLLTPLLLWFPGEPRTAPCCAAPRTAPCCCLRDPPVHTRIPPGVSCNDPPLSPWSPHCPCAPSCYRSMTPPAPVPAPHMAPRCLPAPLCPTATLHPVWRPPPAIYTEMTLLVPCGDPPSTSPGTLWCPWGLPPLPPSWGSGSMPAQPRALGGLGALGQSPLRCGVSIAMFSLRLSWRLVAVEGACPRCTNTG